MKNILPYLIIFIGTLLQSCGNFGAGFAGYDKPSKSSNKYYRRNFKMTNSNLKMGRNYLDLEHLDLNANSLNEYSSFVFFENGFVLHNERYGLDSNNRPIAFLNYSKVHSEDVGSYKINGDTIFWGTRPGYLKRKFIHYYKGIITDSGINIIGSPRFEQVRLLRLQANPGQALDTPYKTRGDRLQK